MSPALAGIGSRIGQIPCFLIVLVLAGRLIDGIRPPLAASLEPSLAVKNLVINNPAQPRPELGFSPELFDFAEANQEDLLSEIESFFLIAETIKRPAPDPILKMNDEALECLHISSLGLADPCGHFVHLVACSGCGRPRRCGALRIPS